MEHRFNAEIATDITTRNQQIIYNFAVITSHKGSTIVQNHSLC
jgi:hypothetical protein